MFKEEVIIIINTTGWQCHAHVNLYYFVQYSCCDVTMIDNLIRLKCDIGLHFILNLILLLLLLDLIVDKNCNVLWDRKGSMAAKTIAEVIGRGGVIVLLPFWSHRALRCNDTVIVHDQMSPSFPLHLPKGGIFVILGFQHCI